MSRETVELVKVYEDKAGHRVEMWRTGNGYRLVVKYNDKVLVEEFYTRLRGAIKRYSWYTTQWVRQPVK